jgi:hypothetical protein
MACAVAEVHVTSSIWQRNLALVLAVLFALLVWPTPYQYQHLDKGYGLGLVRINRITGRLDVLTWSGWDCRNPGWLGSLFAILTPVKPATFSPVLPEAKSSQFLFQTDGRTSSPDGFTEEVAPPKRRSQTVPPFFSNQKRPPKEDCSKAGDIFDQVACEQKEKQN